MDITSEVETVTEWRLVNMPIIAWFDESETEPTRDPEELERWKRAMQAGHVVQQRTVTTSPWQEVPQ